MTRRTRACATAAFAAALTALLAGCVPVIRAMPWDVPVAVGDEVLRLPVPADYAETCAGDRQATRPVAESLLLLACYTPYGDSAVRLEGLVTTLRDAPPGSIDLAEFERYKAALRQQVEQLQSAVNDYRAAGERGGAPPNVLRIVHEGKTWVVHAVARYAAGAAAAGTPTRAGVVATALVRGRLLYLSLLQDTTAPVPWEALGAQARDWAQDTIRRNLR